jgi:hypothetical protein
MTSSLGGCPQLPQTQSYFSIANIPRYNRSLRSLLMNIIFDKVSVRRAHALRENKEDASDMEQRHLQYWSTTMCYFPNKTFSYYHPVSLTTRKSQKDVFDTNRNEFTTNSPATKTMLVGYGISETPPPP